ncbi:WGR domain-containing protein [Sphingobium bisphenolivorans]|uniref:WGR domain-containing protein n=1 Tax=Sphingobium bisphenolivorans TaxID=1335760 RepID=UPI0003A57C96|nr:WGR domain-containing protein [Sphingobium bisphenolivorans]
MERPFPPRLIHLRALDPVRNIARDYSIWMSVDLFGDYVVETCWARIGAAGQRQRFSFPDALSARRHVRAIFRKRRGARKRIGVDYRLVAVATG